MGQFNLFGGEDQGQHNRRPRGRPRGKINRDKREYAKRWRARNPDKGKIYSQRYHERIRQSPEKHEKQKTKQRERMRQYALKEGAKIRALRRLREYGITDQEFLNIFDEQQGKCAICGITISHKSHLDHDHSSGQIRGILCRRCNLTIGALADDPGLAEAAAQYLRKYSK